MISKVFTILGGLTLVVMASSYFVSQGQFCPLPKSNESAPSATMVGAETADTKACCSSGEKEGGAAEVSIGKMDAGQNGSGQDQNLGSESDPKGSCAEGQCQACPAGETSPANTQEDCVLSTEY